MPKTVSSGFSASMFSARTSSTPYQILKSFLEGVAVLQQAAQVPDRVFVAFRPQGECQRLQPAARVRCQSRENLLRGASRREPGENGTTV